MNATVGLETLAGKRYLNLETYRKTGEGVRTPVWFASEPDIGGAKLYVYTTADSGKAKRIRRTSVVKIASCDARGKVTGAWISARAELVRGEPFDHGMRLLDQKYWPWKQVLNMTAMLFTGHQRAMIVIRPV
jgi:PPOX class probable F420-dependent enzyme